MDAPLNSQEYEAYASLVASSTLLQRAITENLHEQQSDLTQVQFEILAALCNAPDGYRMAELADQLIVSRSGLTYQASLLEKAGLITRSRDGSDERGVVARVTDKGRETWERVLPGHLTLVRTAFLGLMKPDELSTLSSLLTRVTSALNGPSKGADDSGTGTS